MKVLQMILVLVLFSIFIAQSESTPFQSRRMKRRLIMRQPMMDMPFEDVLAMYNLGSGHGKPWLTYGTHMKRNFFPISALYQLW